MEKQNSQLEHGQPMELVFHVRFRCGWLSITSPKSLLVNEFDVLSIVHGQVSFAAVIQICLIHKAMNG